MLSDGLKVSGPEMRELAHRPSDEMEFRLPELGFVYIMRQNVLKRDISYCMTSVEDAISKLVDELILQEINNTVQYHV